MAVLYFHGPGYFYNETGSTVANILKYLPQKIYIYLMYKEWTWYFFAFGPSVIHVLGTSFESALIFLWCVQVLSVENMLYVSLISKTRAPKCCSPTVVDLLHYKKKNKMYKIHLEFLGHYKLTSWLCN
jgi:hypothetical protein